MSSSHTSSYKFKRHKNKFQSSRSPAAGSTSSSSSRAETPSNSTPSLAAKNPPPSVIFSDHTARLQRFNIVQKSPVGVLIKRVVDLLRERRQALTTEEIHEACDVDMIEDKNVFENLRKNPKVVYDGRYFSYKSKHGLEDRDEVLKFIGKFPDGIDVDEVEDAYPNVMEDIQAMKAAGEIRLITEKKGETIAYPSDPRATINVDNDLKQLFLEIELPRDMLEIEQELLKNKMKPATDTAKRRMALARIANSEPNKSKKKIVDFSKRKLTNTHLPELFHVTTPPKKR